MRRGFKSVHAGTLAGLVVSLVISSGVIAQAPAPQSVPAPSPAMERQMAARRLAESGDYIGALELLMWCFDDGVKQDPSYAAVRNSFLIREIAELGRKHPPALEALQARRSAAETRLRQGGGTVDDVTTFASINRQLQLDDATLAVYDELLLASKDSELIRLMARLSFEPLLAARRYRDIALGQPDLLPAGLRQFDVYQQSAPPPGQFEGEAAAAFSQIRMRTLRESVGKYYEALVALGQHDDARTLAEKLLDVDPSVETHVALARHALRSANPSADDVAIARTADARLGGRDATSLAVLAELMAMTGEVDPAVTMLQQRTPVFTSSADKTYLEMTLRKLARYAKPTDADFPSPAGPATQPAR